MARKSTYDNESISSLKGADRVRKRPGVIFGSDGLEGCEHAVFEILSNAIDEARGGHGKLITVTRFADRSIQVEDQGRGCPVDWNEKEGRYNWELVFCELYAGGKYDNENSENYEFSLGLNGLGSCATQYASRYMDVTVWRDGKEYRLHFERGEIVGKLEVSDQTGNKKRTGTTIRWLPDLDVFTDIDIPADYYRDVMKRQAVPAKRIACGRCAFYFYGGSYNAKEQNTRDRFRAHHVVQHGHRHGDIQQRHPAGRASAAGRVYQSHLRHRWQGAGGGAVHGANRHSGVGAVGQPTGRKAGGQGV